MMEANVRVRQLQAKEGLESPAAGREKHEFSCRAFRRSVSLPVP